MTNEKIYGMLFNKVFPMLIAKAERKGRKDEEVYENVLNWSKTYDKELYIFNYEIVQKRKLFI